MHSVAKHGGLTDGRLFVQLVIASLSQNWRGSAGASTRMEISLSVYILVVFIPVGRLIHNVPSIEALAVRPSEIPHGPIILQSAQKLK